MSGLANYTEDAEERAVGIIPVVYELKQKASQEPMFVVEDVVVAGKNANGKMKTRPLPESVDSIQSNVLEAGIAVASKIGRVARRGKRVGAAFMIGDSLRVLESCQDKTLRLYQSITTTRYMEPRAIGI